MGAKRALWLLIVMTTLARLVLAASVGPSNDEAYYQLYALHPDLAYFDHPPLLGWLEWLGMQLVGPGTWLGPRLGFVVLSAGSTWLLAKLTTRLHGQWAGLWAAVCLNAVPYYGLAAGTFALPDGPLLFFWLLTLDRLLIACASDRTLPWVAVGLAWGGACLSKYHALLLPVITLAAFVRHAPWRTRLKTMGPYLALALGLFVFSPVLIWNSQHDWVSFRFQGGRALGLTWPRPDYFLRGVGGMALYLTPWLGALLAITLVRARREWRSASGEDRLLLIAASVPLGLVAVVSLFREVLPHWSLIGCVGLLPALGRRRGLELAADRVAMARRGALILSAPLLLGLLLIGQYHFGWFQKGAPGRLGFLSPPADPTVESYGWEQVAERLARHGLDERPGTFVFTGNWYHGGQLARVLRDRATVYCYHRGDARGFAYWTRPEPCVGQDGLLVTVGDNIVEPWCFDRWFQELVPVDTFWVERAGGKLLPVRITRCVGQKRPFPFAGPERVAARD